MCCVVSAALDEMHGCACRTVVVDVWGTSGVVD